MKRKPPVIIDGDEIFGKAERQKPSHCPQCDAEVVKRIIYRLSLENDLTPIEQSDGQSDAKLNRRLTSKNL